MAEKIVFISHRTIDKEVADMLFEFFLGVGIQRNAIFCSSLPGNDVKVVISGEVKEALEKSAVNIAILSQNYYQSAYCLNEAGVFWYKYKDTPVIPIALPEINEDNMYGFLDDDYKIRRLDCDTDVAYIYDTVVEALSSQRTTASVITCENNNIKKKYESLIKTRELEETAPTQPIGLSDITTDDERIVLYYILSENVRKANKATIEQWLLDNEIFDVNIDNAFDLLSSFNGGSVVDYTLELGIDKFRECSANRESIIPVLKEYVVSHTKLAVDTFKRIWDSKSLDASIKMFVAYIVDNKINTFGARWKEERQMESIVQWEKEHLFDHILSENYHNCLELFILNNLVYESDWTDHGNPKEYSLYSSLQNFLFNCPSELQEQLQKIKGKHLDILLG